MNWEIIISSIIGTSGSVFIIYKMFYQHLLNKDLEEIKTKLNLFSKQQERIIDSRFLFYNDVWTNLIDLDIVMDELWEEITNPRLKNFENKIKQTEYSIKKNSLIINKNDYESLLKIIKEFQYYNGGKKRIFESESFRREFVESNSNIRNRTKKLLHNIETDFKKTLGVEK